LDLRPLQLEFTDTQDAVSIALVKCNETVDIEAALYINHDSVRLLKINTFDEMDTFFTFITPLELYTNLLTLLLVCCLASRVIVSPSEAVTVTLGRKINTWRELVIYICSLFPKEKGHIVVQENGQNALKFLKTTFHVADGMFMTDGLYRSQIKYNDLIGLILAVLDAVSAVFKIFDYVVDPFLNIKGRDEYRYDGGYWFSDLLA
jgi:hypothetical protein